MELPAPLRLFGPFVDNEAGKMAACWRNHIYIELPTACRGVVYSAIKERAYTVRTQREKKKPRFPKKTGF
jgi:hypothetical protein